MRFVLLAAVLALSACKREDMYTQGKYQTWDQDRFFKDHTAMRQWVAGTVSRTTPRPDVPQPKAITTAMLDRGQERFNIFCSPCHGASGNGAGMIVQRGFTQAPSLVAGKLRTAKAQVFYDAITSGYGAMYSFADRVAPADRWAVIAYIRALQLSQGADPAALPQDQIARLEAAK